MITRREYDKAVLLSDFIAKIKIFIEENPRIGDVHFIPRINGYEITFSSESHVTKISLRFKKIFSDKLKISFFEDKMLKASFVSSSKENNTEILNKIFT